jgi:hypothetical protein
MDTFLSDTPDKYNYRSGYHGHHPVWYPWDVVTMDTALSDTPDNITIDVVTMDTSLSDTPDNITIDVVTMDTSLSDTTDKYSTERMQPNTLANPEFAPWARSAFAFKNFAFALGSLCVCSTFALGSL